MFHNVPGVPRGKMVRFGTRTDHPIRPKPSHAAKHPERAFSVKHCCKVFHGFYVTTCLLVFYKKS
jgi:hypothetical protein